MYNADELLDHLDEEGVLLLHRRGLDQEGQYAAAPTLTDEELKRARECTRWSELEMAPETEDTDAVATRAADKAVQVEEARE